MVVDLVTGYNRFVQGLQTDPDEVAFGSGGLVHQQEKPSASTSS
jgi:hypothetical protein